MACVLCGAARPLAVAQLRVAFEDRTILVNVCPRCSAMCWRTVDELQRERRAGKTVALPSPRPARFCEATA